jgi:hypothetical protein
MDLLNPSTDSVASCEAGSGVCTDATVTGTITDHSVNGLLTTRTRLRNQEEFTASFRIYLICVAQYLRISLAILTTDVAARTIGRWTRKSSCCGLDSVK